MAANEQKDLEGTGPNEATAQQQSINQHVCTLDLGEFSDMGLMSIRQGVEGCEAMDPFLDAVDAALVERGLLANDEDKFPRWTPKAKAVWEAEGDLKMEVERKFTSQLSTAALLTMSWFMVAGAAPSERDIDTAFRQILIKELFRRGVLSKPQLAHDSVTVAALSKDDLDSFATMFESAADEPTLEQSFVQVTLGHDRFKERTQPSCVECRHDSSTIPAEEVHFIDNGDNYHADCFLVGDAFADLQDRTRWLLRLVTEAFRTFRADYYAEHVRELAASFIRDLDSDLDPLLAEVRNIREAAMQFTQEQTAAKLDDEAQS